MGKFAPFGFSTRPGFNEAEMRRTFSKAVPLKTPVIHCYDPHASETPNAVAKVMGSEVFPGNAILDAAGNHMVSTATMFRIVVAGGRAVDALRSIAVAQHLFGIHNAVVVHHLHCGATSFTAAGIINAYKGEYNRDISDLYDPYSICISDYKASLKHDTALIRAHTGTPAHANVFGYFFDIDTGSLTEVVRDSGHSQATPALLVAGPAILSGHVEQGSEIQRREDQCHSTSIRITLKG